MVRPIHTCCLLLLFLLGLCALPASADRTPTNAEAAAVTILCYLNGDNDLASEVLDALDRLETVGSSEAVQVIALVDGHPSWLAPYDQKWARTRLLRVTRDDEPGKIHATVLEEWGEADLGDPAVLQRFVQTTLSRYPARRYLFYAFAHGRGIINTRQLSPGGLGKTLSISSDESQGSNMPLEEFRQAIENGLAGRRLDMMVLFSCLTNMVEIAYTLARVTDYLLASENEIHLVNQPPGRFQIRGLPFETLVAALHADPHLDLARLGRYGVERHLAAYAGDVDLNGEKDEPERCRFPADMALVDCRALPALARRLDHLAGLLLAASDNPRVLGAMEQALAETAQLASFLNLEYYDLLGLMGNLERHLTDPELRRACQAVMETMRRQVLVCDGRTPDSPATGMSIYLPHPSVPDNIYQTHQALYARSRFGQDTRWDEMIDRLRQRLRSASPEF